MRMPRSREELYQILEQHYFGPNMREEREIERLPQLFEGVRLFVDVGAALGQYTFFANQLLEGAVIYAIEADPIRHERLVELCREWSRSSHGNKIVPLKKAVSDREGQTTFFVTDDDRSGGFFPTDGLPGTDPETFEWRQIAVETVTLDGLFNGRPPPDLVKIDVEGGEHRVLAGSRRLLEQGHTRFMVEVHPWGDPSIGKRPSDLFSLFAHHGYAASRLHHHWLFMKSGRRFETKVKHQLIGFVLDHDRLRRLARGMLARGNVQAARMRE
jgi:FkbM family methyltransferase